MTQIPIAYCSRSTTSASNSSFISGQSYRLLQRVSLVCLLLGLAVISAGCFESKVVTSRVVDHIEGQKPKEMNGIFYALPRTVVKVDVPVVRVDKEPGQFKDDIKCFYPNVGEEDYIKASSTQFKVATDKVKFDTTFVPDTHEIFLIKTRGGQFETRNLELELTESGVLVKASAETTNEGIDIVTGAIKTGVGLVAKASSAGLFNAGGLDELREGLPYSQRNCLSALETSLEAARANVEKSFPTAASETAEQLANRRQKITNHLIKDYAHLVKKADAFIQAQETFKLISDLEDQRRKILSPTDGPPETFKLALDELDKTIENYKQVFFFGTKATLTWNSSFKLNPDDGMKSIELFQLSKDMGVCRILANDPPHEEGVPFDGRFKLPGCKNFDIVKLVVEKGETGEGAAKGPSLAEKIGKAKLGQSGDRGFYFRMPGRAVAYLMLATDELARAPVQSPNLAKSFPCRLRPVVAERNTRSRSTKPPVDSRTS